MTLRTFFLILLLAAIAAFAALNWDVFTTPTTLSLGVASVIAPLGVVMLGLLIAVTIIFLAFVVYLQTSVLLEARRHAKELQSHRELADQAEASRFTELRSFIETHLQGVEARDREERAALMARIDKLDETLRASMQDSTNTVAAYLGELEDKLDNDKRETPAPLPLRHNH